VKYIFVIFVGFEIFVPFAVAASSVTVNTVGKCRAVTFARRGGADPTAARGAGAARY
jgi:hypothetical protein